MHEQVKEKAKQRKMAWTNAHQKKMTHKLVEQEARKQLDREEKIKVQKAKQEDEEIRKEMVKIRKAMQDENRIRAKQALRYINLLHCPFILSFVFLSWDIFPLN